MAGTSLFLPQSNVFLLVLEAGVQRLAKTARPERFMATGGKRHNSYRAAQVRPVLASRVGKEASDTDIPAVNDQGVMGHILAVDVAHRATSVNRYRYHPNGRCTLCPPLYHQLRLR